MYPAVLINYQLYPEHLNPKFIYRYTKVRDDRVEAKRNNDNNTADTFKIVLNSTWGKYLFKNHWLYDPLAGYRITINNQLMMLMLIEELMLGGFKVISANTDGLVTIVPIEKESLYKSICSAWEKVTQFELEYTEYSKYVRKDVNNYITIKTDGKHKAKGVFVVNSHLDKKNWDPKKGFDMPIVSIALQNFYTKGIPIENTILNHDDIYDFCTSQRIDDKFKNIYHEIKNGIYSRTEIQKSVRFYISKTGGILDKYDPEQKKYISYFVGKRVQLLNDNRQSKPIKDYQIDYGYYINETQKILDLITNPQLTLF